MRGGAGDDIYIVDNASDSVTENFSEGTDIIYSQQQPSLCLTIENLVLTGSSDISATGNILNNIFIGNSGDNTLTGNGGDDTLVGNSGNDVLNGGLAMTY